MRNHVWSWWWRRILFWSLVFLLVHLGSTLVRMAWPQAAALEANAPTVVQEVWRDKGIMGYQTPWARCIVARNSLACDWLPDVPQAPEGR